jgi:hypothetical protein
VSVHEAEAAKRAGQEQSIEGREAFKARFFEVVAEVEPGTSVSVNILRAELDRAKIPPSMRGGLFYAASKAGLLKPAVWQDIFGRMVDVYERSTGASAHRATVRVYQRTQAALLAGGHVQINDGPADTPAPASPVPLEGDGVEEVALW